MGKVYTNQEFTLYVRTGIDLSNAGNVQLAGTKPDGSSMPTKSATIDDASKGIIRYDILDTDLEDAGTWIMWAIANFSSATYYGEPFHLNIFSEGS